MTWILIFLLSIVDILYLYFYKTLSNKYNSLISKVGSLVDELNKPLRFGYYVEAYIQNNRIKYSPIIFISEIDRYTNGESKIKIERIELGCSDYDFDSMSAESFTKRDFKSLRKTADIVWLESEQSIKDVRRKKLEQLKQSLL